MNDTPDLSPLALQADDIASLREHLAEGRFVYVDVAAARAHQDALSRWPLLAETHACEPPAGAAPAPGAADARAGGDANGERP